MRRVVVVTEAPDAVRGLRPTLRLAGDLRVVATLDGRRPILGALARLSPDVVLVMALRSRTNTLARLSEVATEVPEARAVLVLGSAGVIPRDEAVAGGAHAVVSGTLGPPRLAEVLRGEAAAGHRRLEVGVTGLGAQELRVARTIA